MGQDAHGRELSDEQVREILADTRPPEGRRDQVDGARSTATVRRSRPTGQVAGAVIDAGAPVSPNHIVPKTGVEPVAVVETADDGGGVTLSVDTDAADPDGDAKVEAARPHVRDDLTRPAADADRPQPDAGSGARSAGDKA